MPTGASPKREHEYKELKDKFKDEHRYPGREEQVASRIVNKQRSEHGETKEAGASKAHTKAHAKANTKTHDKTPGKAHGTSGGHGPSHH